VREVDDALVWTTVHFLRLHKLLGYRLVVETDCHVERLWRLVNLVVHIEVRITSVLRNYHDLACLLMVRLIKDNFICLSLDIVDFIECGSQIILGLVKLCLQSFEVRTFNLVIFLLFPQMLETCHLPCLIIGLNHGHFLPQFLDFQALLLCKIRDLHLVFLID